MKTYYEPLYKLWITAFVEPNPTLAKRKAEKLIGEELDLNFNTQAKTIEYLSNAGGQRLVVWLRQPEASLLSHELIHVIEYCFQARRIPFDLNNTEVIAYLMEHLFDTFEPVVRRT